MDVEAVVWLLVMLFWFVSGVVKQIRGIGKGPAPTGDSAEPVIVEVDPPVPPPPPPAVAPPGRRPEPQPARRQARPPQPPPAAADPLRELFRQLGVEVVPEQPVQGEHSPTASERQRTASEHRRTASETRRTASEHQRTASETRVTASEHRGSAGEHLRTVSEHLPGDVTGPIERVTSPPRTTRRRGGALGRSVKRQLRGGSRSLAKSWLMKEILSPAPGLKPGGRQLPEV